MPQSAAKQCCRIVRQICTGTAGQAAALAAAGGNAVNVASAVSSLERQRCGRGIGHLSHHLPPLPSFLAGGCIPEVGQGEPAAPTLREIKRYQKSTELHQAAPSRCPPDLRRTGRRCGCCREMLSSSTREPSLKEDSSNKFPVRFQRLRPPVIAISVFPAKF